MDTDIGTVTRHMVRDALSDGRIMVRATKDICLLLLNDEKIADIDVDIVQLWDDKNGLLKSGVLYTDDEIDEGNGVII